MGYRNIFQISRFIPIVEFSIYDSEIKRAPEPPSVKCDLISIKSYLWRSEYRF